MHNVYANHAHFRGQAERSLMLYIINSVSDLSTIKLLHGHFTVTLAISRPDTLVYPVICI